ncbi:MAG: cysteine desulfurase family protein [Pirellulales bacterium]
MHVFLDHNSTTPVLDEVVDCMVECYAHGYGNPASQHAVGRQARRLVEDARDCIAGLLGANLAGRRPDRLIFTSGGTEANNLAILGLAGERQGRLVVSAIEHPSVLGPAEFLAQRGWQIERANAEPTGVVGIDRFVELLAGDGPGIAAIILGNNETGVLQPVAELARTCHERGVRLHTDAVQVVGKLPVDFAALGVATLAFSAHKFHGPRGIGGLVVRGDIELQPVFYGGFQQGGLRPGTEPVALIVGMQKALELWRRDRDQRLQRMTALRDRFEAALRGRVSGLIVNGVDAKRLPHTSNVSFPGLDRRALAMALDLDGIACSTGSACASGSSEPSPVLIAMGLSDEVVAGSLRFSLGATTSEAEIDTAIERVVSVVERLGARNIGNTNCRSR